MMAEISKGPSESQHQMAVMKWTQQESIRRKWPELKLLLHIPNERYCTLSRERIYNEWASSAVFRICSFRSLADVIMAYGWR